MPHRARQTRGRRGRRAEPILQASASRQSPKYWLIKIWNERSSLRRSIRPFHLEHVFRLDLEIVTAAAGADDRLGPGGLVDAVLDHGLVDMDGDDFTEGDPGLR